MGGLLLVNQRVMYTKLCLHIPFILFIISTLKRSSHGIQEKGWESCCGKTESFCYDMVVGYNQTQNNMYYN